MLTVFCSKERTKNMTNKMYAVWGALVLLLGSLLAWQVSAHAGATAEARLLDEQLQGALGLVAVAEERTDSVMAQLDSVNARAESVLAISARQVQAARAAQAQAAAAGQAAFTDAVALTGDSLPTMRLAIVRLRQEHLSEVVALRREVAAERSASDALRSQVTAYVATVSSLEFQTGNLRDALALAQEESDAWERAANPGFAMQLWRQGRVATLVLVLALALR